MKSLCGGHYAQPEGQHHALLHNEKDLRYEGEGARHLTHAGKKVYGAEAYGPRMDQKGSGENIIAIEPSLS